MAERGLALAGLTGFGFALSLCFLVAPCYNACSDLAHVLAPLPA